jgi:hypothetical protein
VRFTKLSRRRQSKAAADQPVAQCKDDEGMGYPLRAGLIHLLKLGACPESKTPRKSICIDIGELKEDANSAQRIRVYAPYLAST